MKKYFFLLLLILGSAALKAQVVVTPYVVLIDEKNRFGTYTVINQTDEEQEVAINFYFGYPVSDEQGNVTMKYDENPGPSVNDITPYIKVFPRKFILRPKEKQIVRMTIEPPAGLAKGTYWTRIMTSSQNKQVYADTTKNLSARINFVLNQITTILFKNGQYKNAINLKDLSASTDTSSLNLVASIEANGDQPFFGNFEYKIYDSSNKVVKEESDFVSVYYDMKAKTSIPLSELSSGSYIAKLTISTDDSPDIPRPDNSPITPIEKSISFSIP